MRLAVLDQSAAAAGKPHEATIRETIALAQSCEAMGYHRYWLAEHHNSPANVGSAPEILAAAIAAATRRIRVGSAGVLLSHYAPLKVAEQFRMLCALTPARIDLGMGRSPGGNAKTQALLDRAAGVRPFPELVKELLGFLDAEEPDDPEAVLAYPRTASLPEPWILGSSSNGAALAARLGLPFCFNVSHGTNHHLVGEAVSTYRRDFRPSRRLAAPFLSLSVWVLAAETEREALRLFAPRAYWRVMLDRSVRTPMLPPEHALREGISPPEATRVEETLRTSIVGSADDVAQRLHDIARIHKAEELVLGTWTFDAEDRRRSYEVIAQRLACR